MGARRARSSFGVSRCPRRCRTATKPIGCLVAVSPLDVVCRQMGDARLAMGVGTGLASPHSQPRASRSDSYPCERVWEPDANGGDWPRPSETGPVALSSRTPYRIAPNVSPTTDRDCPFWGRLPGRVRSSIASSVCRLCGTARDVPAPCGRRTIHPNEAGRESRHDEITSNKAAGRGRSSRVRSGYRGRRSQQQRYAARHPQRCHHGLC